MAEARKAVGRSKLLLSINVCSMQYDFLQLLPLPLQGRHAQSVKVNAIRPRKDYVTEFENSVNPR